MDNYCVYKHTCPNGKVYIGITKQNPLERWRGGLGYRYNEHFFAAITKYGWDNIRHEILVEALTADEAAAKEKELIKEYKSTDRLYGYNIATGGFETVASAETRMKLSRATKEQYASGKRSRTRSAEANQKTSETLKRRFANGELVRVISQEQRKKIAEKHKGQKVSEERRKRMQEVAHKKDVMQYVDDEVIAVYSGVREAGRMTGIEYTSIIKVAKGIKHTAGGYSWKYVD